MNTPLRISPIYDSVQALSGSWREINGMPSLVTTHDQGVNVAHLGVADLSFLNRFGVKGAGAADWLASQNITVPERPNTWCQSAGGIVARLGRSEFLIEDSMDSQFVPQLTLACQSLLAKVYPVLRQDAAIALCGSAVNELLQQTCSINFRALPLSEHPVVLTSMIGVAVTVIPGERNELPFYRIWCDGTFGTYVWQTLLAIAQELGGGAVGAQFIS